MSLMVLYEVSLVARTNIKVLPRRTKIYVARKRRGRERRERKSRFYSVFVWEARRTMKERKRARKFLGIP